MNEKNESILRGRTRNVQVKFRLTEYEAEQLQRKLKQSGLSQQQYLIKAALDKKIVQVDGMTELMHAVSDLVYEMRKIGNNLNQLTQHLNEEKKWTGISSVPEEEVKKLGFQIREKIQEVDSIWPLLRQLLHQPEEELEE